MSAELDFLDIMSEVDKVVSSEQLNEDLDIKKSIKRPGQLHRDLGYPEGTKIPYEAIVKAAKQGGKVGQRARFALTLSKFRKNK